MREEEARRERRRLFLIHNSLLSTPPPPRDPLSHSEGHLSSMDAGMLKSPAKTTKTRGSEACEMHWRLRSEQELVNILIICFDMWLTHAVLRGDVHWCEYSRVGRRGTPCRNSLRQSSLVWAGWPSLCSHRTGLASAVGRHKHLHFFHLLANFTIAFLWHVLRTHITRFFLSLKNHLL